jgi:hypothetical protein
VAGKDTKADDSEDEDNMPEHGSSATRHKRRQHSPQSKKQKRHMPAKPTTHPGVLGSNPRYELLFVWTFLEYALVEFEDGFIVAWGKPLERVFE